MMIKLINLASIAASVSASVCCTQHVVRDASVGAVALRVRDHLGRGRRCCDECGGDVDGGGDDGGSSSFATALSGVGIVDKL